MSKSRSRGQKVMVSNRRSGHVVSIREILMPYPL